VRPQRVGNRADGILVLLEVLARAGQRGGEGQVVLVVTGALDRAGQDSRGDQSLLQPDQHLRGRADQAVDCENPGGVVALGQARQQPAHVDRAIGLDAQVPCEHHFVQRTVGDPLDRLTDGAGPLGRGESAVGEGNAVGLPGRLLRDGLDRARQRRVRADSGHPP
jgi:hypothetical protein